MKDIKLIDGRFKQSDAEHLLTKLFKVKISFHEQKIKTVHISEEDIKHSEKRIKELEQSLRSLLSELKSHPGSFVDIDADISVKMAS